MRSRCGSPCRPRLFARPRLANGHDMRTAHSRTCKRVQHRCAIRIDESTPGGAPITKWRRCIRKLEGPWNGLHILVTVMLRVPYSRAEKPVFSDPLHEHDPWAFGSGPLRMGVGLSCKGTIFKYCQSGEKRPDPEAATEEGHTGTSHLRTSVSAAGRRVSCRCRSRGGACLPAGVQPS